MLAILIFIIALSGGGFTFLILYLSQLKSRAAETDRELVALRARYETEQKHWTDFQANANTQHQALVNKYNENVRKWNESTILLRSENERLSKWKSCADAEVKAAEMLSHAQTHLEYSKTEANNLLATAQREANTLRLDAEQKAATELTTAKELAAAQAAEAREKAKSLRTEAQEVLNSATSYADRVIKEAEQKAQLVAGSANEAMKNASLYEQAIKSMKNIIDGYGNKYIVPPHSLLDDLAEEFSYEQAGRELKRARVCVDVMVRNGTAASCQYVEANRRDTAINFVVDAFNGKG